MAHTPATFKDLFPEFAAEGDSRVQSFLDMAGRRVSETIFGTFYDDAIGFVTAHLLSKSAVGGSRGAVVSETVGNLSRSYAQIGGSPGYSSTSYGQEFLRLLRIVQPTPAVM